MKKYDFKVGDWVEFVDDDRYLQAGEIVSMSTHTKYNIDGSPITGLLITYTADIKTATGVMYENIKFEFLTKVPNPANGCNKTDLRIAELRRDIDANDRLFRGFDNIYDYLSEEQRSYFPAHKDKLSRYKQKLQSELDKLEGGANEIRTPLGNLDLVGMTKDLQEWVDNDNCDIREDSNNSADLSRLIAKSAQKIANLIIRYGLMPNPPKWEHIPQSAFDKFEDEYNKWFDAQKKHHKDMAIQSRELTKSMERTTEKLLEYSVGLDVDLAGIINNLEGSYCAPNSTPIFAPSYVEIKDLKI